MDGQAPPPPPPTTTRAGRGGPGRTVLVGALVVALVAAALGWAQVVQQRRTIDGLQGRADEADAELADLREQLARAERQAADGPNGTDDEGASAGPDDLAGLLEGLLGGDLGGLEDLLGGLGGLGGLGDLGDLDDLDGLEDLLGQGLGAGAPGAECATGEVAPDPAAPDVDLDTGPSTLVDEVTDQVAALRGLSPDGELDVAFLGQEDFAARIAALVEEDLEGDAVDLDERVLGALGAVPDDVDLRRLTVDLLSSQAAGLYEPETGELVVLRGASLDGRAAAVVAHEVLHAIADDALGLPALDDPAFDTDGDAALATLAVVEGDATLTMQQWTLAHLSLQDQLALAQAGTAAQADLEGVPPFLVQQLEFPYLRGLSLACFLLRTGGWEAVDAAYASPPATTAQVLDPTHPGVVGQPVSVAAPAGWQQARTTTLGAAPLSWLVAAPDGDASAAAGESLADAAVQAWGGDQLRLWTDEDRSLVSWSLVDSGRGDVSLCEVVRDGWLAPSFGSVDTVDGVAVAGSSGEVAAVACDGDRGDVVVSVAPDRETAVAVATQRVG